MTWTPPPDFVDLRSDTMTRPSDAMREAMRDAEVGNASFGEDPTVNRLEEVAARVLGKEAALFVPSGTMGNQIAIRVHTARTVNPEVICEARAHVHLNEAGGVATVSGAQIRALPGTRGALDPADVATVVQRGGYDISPTPALVCLENTHNFAGGTVIRPDAQAAIREVAHANGVPVHLDGARVFNAAAALDVAPDALARDADTVQFCFSKGLGAPFGSILCGSADVIREAKKVRQYLGGGLRQAGVVAAAALVGLEEERHRLKEDHARAARLAKGVADAPGLRVVEPPETNILILDVSALDTDPGAFVSGVAAHGVGLVPISATEVRAVTHRDVDDAGIARAIDAVHAVAKDVGTRA